MFQLLLDANECMVKFLNEVGSVETTELAGDNESVLQLGWNFVKRQELRLVFKQF